MGWASEVIDSPNGNALLRFCFISDSIPEPDSIFKPCFLMFIVISFIEKYFLCYFKRFIENCFVTKVLFFLYARFEILTPISLMFIEAFKSRSCKCPQTSQL